MPTIYRRAENIDELKGQVQDGLAVIAHSPDDVPGLEGFVDTVGRLPGDPLANMYRVLNNAGRTADMWLRAERTTVDSLAAIRDEPFEGRDERTWSLRVCLALGRDAWLAQGEDLGELAMALVVPRPGRQARLESRRPALVLDYGSIRARVLAAGGKLRDFGVALFPVARSKRRANIVQALRDNAKGLRLPRLDSIKGRDLENKSGVVIFLHGLMSTDAGTFDGFVTHLSAAQFAQPLLLVSWPHDTLASIDANAEDLSVLIEDTLGGSSLPVAFVCHSRGGLVARRTAVELMEIDKARWQPRLRGLITFGTPHDGAELAESGDELVGKLLLLHTVAKQGGLIPLVDALWSVKDHKRLAGVTDLRPRSNGGDFLRRLRNAEGRIAKKAGAMPIPLYAVGGDASSKGVTAMLSRRYFGGAAHDLVVTLASATPRAAEQSAETTCNHFGYFTANEVAGPAAARALDFLEQTMAIANQSSATPASVPKLKLSKPLKINRAKAAASSTASGDYETPEVST